jgi:hypothetical protein
MNTQIKFLPLLILLALPFFAGAQSIGKTFNKSFNADEKGVLRLDLPGQLDLKIWDNPTIRFEINVSIPSGNSSMLNELANVGRYNLIARSIDADDALMISAPNLQKKVTIKGVPLREEITYTIYAPKTMKIEMPGTFAVAAANK